MTYMGYALPLWILGAPLIVALVERMRTPRVAGNERTTFRAA